MTSLQNIVGLFFIFHNVLTRSQVVCWDVFTPKRNSVRHAKLGLYKNFGVIRKKCG